MKTVHAIAEVIIQSCWVLCIASLGLSGPAAAVGLFTGWWSFFTPLLATVVVFIVAGGPMLVAMIVADKTD